MGDNRKQYYTKSTNVKRVCDVALIADFLHFYAIDLNYKL